MARLHYSMLQATLDADIDDNDTTITFTAPLREWGEDNIATIAAPNILTLRVGYELIHVTAYTSGASTATVLRGQEGSTATAHAEGDILRHTPTADDFDIIDLAGHLSDTSDAHDASAISYAGGTDVEAALDELATEKADLASPALTGAPTAPTPSTGDNDTSIATTAFVVAEIPLRAAPLRLTQNAQTGTSYTLVLTDEQKLVELANVGAITLTVPPNSSVAFPVGTQIHIAQTGAGQVTITPGSGVTINAQPGLKTSAQWAAVTLIKRATDTWLAIGALAA
jgi:hypothetical protein